MKADTINSVDRALEILITIYENGREMGISELSEQLGIYKSTVFRTLKTLEDRGFLRQNPVTKGYWFGMKLYAIGLTIGEKMHLQDIIAPHSSRLFKECKEIVNASVLEDTGGDFHKSIIVYKETGDGRILSTNQPLGSSSFCYCSAVGKCLLAFTRDIDLSIYKRESMESFTKNTLVDRDQFFQELEQVRSQGYALDKEEREIGLTCIGAPILDREGNAVAAISLSGPTARMADENMDMRIHKLLQTAKDISNEFR